MAAAYALAARYLSSRSAASPSAHNSSISTDIRVTCGILQTCLVRTAASGLPRRGCRDVGAMVACRLAALGNGIANSL